jgi:hypothetical protein
MSSFIDLTNQRFGNLMAISRAENIKGSTRWNCICNCGNNVTISYASLIRDKSEKCKCRKNLINHKYGQLIVISKSEKMYRGKWPLWVCECICGNIVEVRESSLKYGTTRSCGCLQRSRKLLPGIWGFNQLFYRYRHDAKKRSIAFNLTKEEAMILFKGACYYCGDLPNQIMKPFNDEISTFIYNGIDRKNNSGSYSVENSVSCCKWCNFMKSDYNLEDFILHIEDIIKCKGK